MKNIFKLLLTLSFLLFVSDVYSMTDKEKAYTLGMQAVNLMDNNKIDESIKLLEEAQELDPNQIDYPYELSYAYYLKKDYQKASKYLEGILNHEDINDRVFQLLGNCYDYLDRSEEAITTYEKGLEKFPDSGNLYLEMGIMQLGKKNYDKAMYYHETGIEVAPEFSSNYYWASKLYCSTTEEVWGLIYGEIFMNLERNSKRTVEISKLLFDTYKQAIEFTNDTSFSVSFSQNSIINIQDTKKDKSSIKSPFGITIYEPTIIFSMLTIKEININSLNTIRTNFVTNYYQNKHNILYPNILFDYQKKLKEMGHLEAYNHWLLMKGDEDGFEKWRTQNENKWSEFTEWFLKNKITINENNKFHRNQY